VPRTEFAAVWVAAERRCHEQGAVGVTDWHAAGVAVNCEWLAAAVVGSRSGLTYPARSPVTRRTARAHEELIEAEFLAAETAREPDGQPGWAEAVRATLRWAWRCSDSPPLPGAHDQPARSRAGASSSASAS
jgi:hypothetical protein